MMSIMLTVIILTVVIKSIMLKFTYAECLN
jgi:hypothetical protein